MNHSFPTRRSSDLDGLEGCDLRLGEGLVHRIWHAENARIGDMHGSEDVADLNIFAFNLPEAALAMRDIHSRRQRRCFRSEEHTSELQSLMRISYAVFCLKKKKKAKNIAHIISDK